MSLDGVRARIAELMLAPRVESVTRVGAFSLRPAQQASLVTILAAVYEFGGALIADPPGTGKTVLALAAAKELATEHASVAPRTLVVAPAPLRAQWIESAARAGIGITFVSLDALSRGRAPERAPIVIIDEAHHARTPTTRRYARLAECCVGARVLLLSATPVVNRAGDRDALLALFLGAQSGSLTPGELARCVVRANEDQPAADEDHARMSDESAPTVQRPTVKRLGVIGRGVDLPRLGAAIAALPPPLSITEGSDARALVVMSLAMAWRSSLAALDAALRRRIQRGEAMRDLLRAGRRPSRAMLRHWVLHDDATQLAMEPLLAPAGNPGPHASSNTDPLTGPPRTAITTLESHLRAVADARELIRPHRQADAAARAGAIRELARAHPSRRIVVFAQHTETIRAIHAALRAEPGVVAIIGARVIAAAGRWSRDEVLRAIGPRAHPPRIADPRAIRIVLATDVVAEGVEMQGVSIVVHADIPWTPARLEQRVGRVTRVGSPHREVLEARLGAPVGARSLTRLGARLQRKSDARLAALRDARAQARISGVLEGWRSRDRDAHVDPVGGETTIHAASRGDRDAFIGIVGDPPQWIVGERHADRWRISSAPSRVARLLRAVTGEECAPNEASIRNHERRIARAIERRAARTLVSSNACTAHSVATSEAPPIVHRRIARVRTRFARLLAFAPSLARAEIAARQAELLSRLGRPLELARERRIDALLRSDIDDATFARRLGALLHDEARERGTSRDQDEAPRNDKSRPDRSGRLHCLLILSRDSGSQRAPRNARRAVSPGTAAPR